ncbi:MAG TPA: hypothetical protein VHJ39_01105 [Solirubrobacteraceae bacterium]|jgi:hypothetical protein|nr:hypothetical protein [Solirubrobacteraceae bacterium]
MSRRFEVGPLLVALGAIILLVSLFLEWYGTLTAWEAFEVVEVLLAVLAVGALVIAVGLLLPDLGYVERRWLPPVVAGATILVVAEVIDPPPIADGEDLAAGAWFAFGSVFLMCAGALLTFGRLSFALSLEDRDVRERVPVVDHRQDTTDTVAVKPDEERPGER